MVCHDIVRFVRLICTIFVLIVKPIIMNSIFNKLVMCSAGLAAICMPHGISADDTAANRPTAYLVSDAHLDTQWNWDIQTTIKDYVWNTLNLNLELLNKYPDYVFNFEGGVKYAWMKEYFPREYEMMKPYIKNGRWHISGASWDANDAIVPSTESAIRNILLGQEFYRNEFGVESTDIFLPDCFGFGWTLPTIASHCGLIGFSSQKLGWRQKPFHGDSRYPFSIGLWQGVDGSKIMMAHAYIYTQRWNNEDLTRSELLLSRASESPLNIVYHYYGTGDIGGSPTITSVDAVERALSGDGPLKVYSAASDRMYKDFLPYDSHPELPEYNGELLMDVHGTGCYTSQAAMKLYNRQNELLGDAAERASVGAEMLGMLDYPSSSLTEAWRRFILHQFHDDLTGTSIPRAYEFSWNDELLSLKQFANTMTAAVGAVSERLDTRVKGTAVAVYNPLGFAATDIVKISVPASKQASKIEVYDAQGRPVSVQKLPYSDNKVHFLARVTVPANGVEVFDVRISGKGNDVDKAVAADGIENSRYRLKLDANGDIVSLYDKSADKELVKPGKSIRLAMFNENESYPWPAWEIIKKTIDADPVSITGNVSVRLIDDGQLRKTLCVTKTAGDSKFTQYIHLYEGELADRIDFENVVDWRSLNSLLKAEFPLTVSDTEATYDLGIGTIRRGNNTDIAYEVPAQYWADLTDKDSSYGVTIMNDCKYGWDKPDDNTLRLTLLHTPKTDRGYAYQDHQDLGHHVFTYSIVGHSGKLDTADARRHAEVLNQRMKPFVVPKHKGDLGRSFSLASVDNGNILIKALKKAESSDYYVVRVYETGGARQDGNITFAADIVEAFEADGTEKTVAPAQFKGKSLAVSVKPNSLKTYKVKLAKDAPVKRNFMALPLDYDRKCFTWNNFTGDGEFSESYTYAAELVPSTLVSDGVTFELENKALFNGHTCKGDTLKLPEGHKFNKLYILAAAAMEDAAVSGTVRAGKKATDIVVPSYTGFIGQWGHEGHTEGYLYDADVAWTGTHRHSPNGDHPYEFTYMYRIPVDIPANTTEIILPDNKDLVVFAATAVEEEYAPAVAAAELFRTANVDNKPLNMAGKGSVKENILRPEHVVASSGFTNDREAPALLVDGNVNTKWCDVGNTPSFVEFDLGRPETFTSWKIVNAGNENNSYVTGAWLVQTRNAPGEDWKTVECVTANNLNVLSKKFDDEVTARYVRLYVLQPAQSTGGEATRIYEFALYK